MTKMIDKARPSSPSLGRRPQVVARPGIDARDSAGFRRGMRDAASDAALSRSDAHSLGALMARRYRERVDVEIRKASERGARWWSRRLVQLYEDAGLVRLD
jgi:hypothetical protein